MNTKGIKFLAVLAVMVMAFAAVLVLAPADENADAVNIMNFDDVQIDPVEITGAMTTSGTGYTEFYISDDAAVKVRALSQPITIYVQNGKELELDFKAAAGQNITIYSVTSDLEQKVISQNTSAYYPDGDTNGGKLIIEGTELTFLGEKGQTVTYKALMPASVKTKYNPTTSTSAAGVPFETTVKTKTDSGTQMYATISSDRSLGEATIGKFITIASGQYIEVTDNSAVEMTAYGVLITDVDTSTTYTYYAKDANAGSFTMDNSGDEVFIKTATITVKNGSSTVKASSLSGSFLTVDPTSTTDGLTLSGTFYDGSIIASGSVTFESDFSVGDAYYPYATATIANNTTVNTSTAAVYGTLVLKNADVSALTVTGTGIVKADNIKLWDYTDPAAPAINFDDTGFDGQIDISSITEVAEVKDRFATANIVENQTFRVVADTTVTTALLVEGVLIVDEGVTLTISKLNTNGAAVTLAGKYAQVINNGEIIIKTTASSVAPAVGLQVNGGMFVNNGRIAGSSDSTDKGPTLSVDVEQGYGFENNGTVTMSRNDAVAFSSGFTNNGTMTINSSISVADGAVKNAGSFVLNNAEVVNNVNITTVPGATVSIAAILEKNEYVKVIAGLDGSVDDYIMIAAPSDLASDGTLTVRGINIVDDSSFSKWKNYLDLSGVMGVTKSATVTGTAWYPTLTMAGNINISGTVVVPENIKISATSTTLSVTGEATLAKKATDLTDNVGSGLQMTVKGTVTSVEGDRLSGCKYTAAKYSYTNGTTVYTNFADAIAEATLLDIATVEVGNISASSYVTVTSDVTIPAGMTVTGKKIAIGDSKNASLVALESTAGLSIDDITVVNGMIVAENMNDVDDSAIKADVKVEDDETYGVTYMSLKVALSLASAGDVIELNQDVVITDSTLVIPADVEVNSMEDERALVLINSDLIVNGVLATEPFYFVATVDDTKSITVNGYMIDKDEDGDCIAGHWFTPIGVSYHLTEVDDYGNEYTYYVITNLDNLQPSILIADEAKVTVEGDAKLGDLTIYGTDDMPAEVTFNGNISAGTLTLDDVTIIAKEGKKVNATFKDALGSITITGAYVKSKQMTIYTEDNGGVYMTGAITDGVTSTYSIRFDGVTGIDGTNSGAVIGWGNYVDEDEANVAYPSILFNGTTLSTGKKVLIQNNADDVEPTRANAGIVTITGSLIADNGNKLTIIADTEVVGSLVALEKTEEATAGSIEIDGHLFVGALMSDIYSANDAIAAYHDDVGGIWEIDEYGKKAHIPLAAAALISGKIEVGEAYFITVLEGSDVDPAIVEDLDFAVITIDGEEWLTVYGTSSYSLDGLKAPIYNADVTEILDIDGNKVAKFSQVYKVIYGSVQKPLSQYGGIISIDLDYEVFAVKIKTDGSVKAVYIDGILMETGQEFNIFTLTKQTTGTHKVTVEPATGYDADKCVLYTEMGTILPGMAFTFTEFDCEFSEELGAFTVTYNINGTEIQPEPVPPTPEEESQWTVTTILLVILVVLIAIMAVIVALRLNRS